MASVVEHTTVDGVVGAFESSNATKFSIFQGTTPIMTFNCDDQSEAANKLQDCLDAIEAGGSTAVYKLQIYNDDVKTITNKTPYAMATRFQLHKWPGDKHVQEPGGNGVILVRGGERPAAAGRTGSTDFLLQQLVDSNRQMMEALKDSIQQKEKSQIGELVDYLKTQHNIAPVETDVDKLVKLGQAIIEKPEIIDRIGYIIRPSAYQQQQPEFVTHETQINGTDNGTANNTKMKDNETPGEALTEEEEAALADRLDKALDRVEGIIGLEELVDVMEALASAPDDKISRLDAEKMRGAITFL